jgi:hypothetical protein
MNRMLLLLILFIFGCDTGKLKVIADLPTSLKEISAIEISSASDLFWVIEDSGNDTKLFGLNLNGKIDKTLEVTNAQNIDWEDLAMDSKGDIYIGNF